MSPTPHFGILTVLDILNNLQKIVDLDFKKRKKRKEINGKEFYNYKNKRERDIKQFCSENKVTFKIIQTQLNINNFSCLSFYPEHSGI